MKGFFRFLCATLIGAALLLYGNLVASALVCLWQKGGSSAIASFLAKAPKVVTLSGAITSAVESAVLYGVFTLIRGKHS